MKKRSSFQARNQRAVSRALCMELLENRLVPTNVVVNECPVEISGNVNMIDAANAAADVAFQAHQTGSVTIEVGSSGVGAPSSSFSVFNGSGQVVERVVSATGGSVQLNVLAGETYYIQFDTLDAAPSVERPTASESPGRSFFEAGPGGFAGPFPGGDAGFRGDAVPFPAEGLAGAFFFAPFDPRVFLGPDGMAARQQLIAEASALPESPFAAVMGLTLGDPSTEMAMREGEAGEGDMGFFVSGLNDLPQESPPAPGQPLVQAGEQAPGENARAILPNLIRQWLMAGEMSGPLHARNTLGETLKQRFAELQRSVAAPVEASQVQASVGGLVQTLIQLGSGTDVEVIETIPAMTAEPIGPPTPVEETPPAVEPAAPREELPEPVAVASPAGIAALGALVMAVRVEQWRRNEESRPAAAPFQGRGTELV